MEKVVVFIKGLFSNLKAAYLFVERWFLRGVKIAIVFLGFVFWAYLMFCAFDICKVVTTDYSITFYTSDHFSPTFHASDCFQ